MKDQQAIEGSLPRRPGRGLRARLGAGLAALLAILSLLGCDAGQAAKTVDFSQTIPLARPGEEEGGLRPFRVAVAAMVSPKETFIAYRQLLDYLGRRLGRKIELIQRQTYGEISDLLRRGGLEAAFICSGPYALDKERTRIELLATPQIRGVTTYQSYLLVQAGSPAQDLADLKGGVFAFTDPDSNTGRLVPLAWLAELGERPETFFRQTIYTYSHDNAIMAVARGLVDGAAVDGLIWEHDRARHPGLTSRTRVIRKSEPFGSPPVVVAAALAPEEKAAFREAILTLHEDLAGRRLMDELMIERFVPGREEWYDSIRHLRGRISGASPES